MQKKGEKGDEYRSYIDIKSSQERRATAFFLGGRSRGEVDGPFVRRTHHTIRVEWISPVVVEREREKHSG